MYNYYNRQENITMWMVIISWRNLFHKWLMWNGNWKSWAEMQLKEAACRGVTWQRARASHAFQATHLGQTHCQYYHTHRTSQPLPHSTFPYHGSIFNTLVQKLLRNYKMFWFIWYMLVWFQKSENHQIDYINITRGYQ